MLIFDFENNSYWTARGVLTLSTVSQETLYSLIKMHHSQEIKLIFVRIRGYFINAYFTITLFGMVWYFLNSEHCITWIFNFILFLWLKCQYSHLANGEIETEDQIWLPRIPKAPVMMQLNIWAAACTSKGCSQELSVVPQKLHISPSTLSRGCCLQLYFRYNILACNYAFGRIWAQKNSSKVKIKNCLLSSTNSIVFPILQYISL